MIFRQLFHAESGTFTYLLACGMTRRAALIDPVLGELDKYLQLLRELGLELTFALDTHVHADHITALGALRERTGCISMMGVPARAACISRAFRDGDVLEIGSLRLEVLYTPGHTDDSYCFLLRTEVDVRVFTGDTLLIRGSGRTDFQNGSAQDQYHSLFGKLLRLPDEVCVYPGHDYKGWSMSTMGEERAHNPRLQVRSEQEYVALMLGLKLASPKLMDVAVPANLACGRVDD